MLAAIGIQVFLPAKPKHCTVVKLMQPDGATKEWHNVRNVYPKPPFEFRHGKTTVYILDSGAYMTVYKTPFLEHAEKVIPKEEP